ncbi:hypothetical protein F4778DRAFT_789586 [Xylariomycetidae sp. FL2044]|nr:hypothetical protein F4778DRAFT_789586 [Xylariomycetidae sp. FL2044]
MALPFNHPPPDFKDRVADHLQDTFNRDPRFSVDLRRTNVNGILLRVKQSPDPAAAVTAGAAGPQRFFVKASWGGPDATRIMEEAAYTFLLRWAKHTPNWVDLGGADPLAVYPYPYFITKKIENGNWEQFRSRLANARVPLGRGGGSGDGGSTAARLVVPNRLLWPLFACLIRACVAIAWPPTEPQMQQMGEEDDDDEEVPGDSEPRRIVHNDVHQENIMFGPLEPPVRGRTDVPVSKIIDFGNMSEMPPCAPVLPVDRAGVRKFDEKLDEKIYGRASNSQLSKGPRNQATEKNVLDIGCVMVHVIKGVPWASPSECRQFMLDEHATTASLDPELRMLIRRCIAVDPANRPSLESLTQWAEYCRFNKTAAEDYPGSDVETDEYLRRVIQTCVLDADTEDTVEWEGGIDLMSFMGG